MRSSDWSSDVCSSDLDIGGLGAGHLGGADEQGAPVVAAQHAGERAEVAGRDAVGDLPAFAHADGDVVARVGHPDRALRVQADAVRIVRAEIRSEEHTSELQSLMRTSYAVFCLKQKKEYKNVKNKH